MWNKLIYRQNYIIKIQKGVPLEYVIVQDISKTINSIINWLVDPELDDDTLEYLSKNIRYDTDLNKVSVGGIDFICSCIEYSQKLRFRLIEVLYDLLTEEDVDMPEIEKLTL